MMLIAGRPGVRQSFRAASNRRSRRRRSPPPSPIGFPSMPRDPRQRDVKQGQFYLRGVSGSKALDDDEEQTYLAQRWPGAA